VSGASQGMDFRPVEADWNHSGEIQLSLITWTHSRLYVEVTSFEADAPPFGIVPVDGPQAVGQWTGRRLLRPNP
jgi:hypothetical protein